MAPALPFIYLAVAAVGTGVAIYGAEQQAAQQNANMKHAADQAQADADAQRGAAQVEAQRIRNLGKVQQSSAIAAEAAGGISVDSDTSVKIDQTIGYNASHDAFMEITAGENRAKRLESGAAADTIAGQSALQAGDYRATSQLISFGAQATNYGNGWARSPPGTSPMTPPPG